MGAEWIHLEPFGATLHLLRATLAVLFALALAVPAEASPEVRTRVQLPAQLFVSGLHANQVEPIVRGVFLESAAAFVYGGCWLALASEDTCLQIANDARTKLE